MSLMRLRGGFHLVLDGSGLGEETYDIGFVGGAHLDSEGHWLERQVIRVGRNGGSIRGRTLWVEV